MSRALVLASGGLDSTTLAYFLAAQGYDLTLLSFDYGQKHDKELVYAAMCARSLHAEHRCIDISSLSSLFKGSALTDTISVPDGHYTDERMRITVVPNRNAVLLSLAYALAVSEQFQVVSLGVHAGDHPIYPDCREEFIVAFDKMEKLATDGYAAKGLRLLAPFVYLSKAQIVSLGYHLGLPFAQTWSCYKGRENHCGRCGTCVERIEAFKLAGVYDPTEYEKEVVQL